MSIKKSVLLSGDLNPSQTIEGILTIPPVIVTKPYEGSYSVIPSAETQILETKETWLSDNIIIDPIPNNYGLITWDGAILTVS